jgi:EmrB/QacA subfamily drug resistance transporter
MTDEKNGAADPRRWLALTVILFAGFMDLLDLTIVNVTIPSILHDLHASYGQIEWIVAGYSLGFAAVLIVAGRLGDIFGRKLVFLAGVAGFTVATALCGAAVNPAMLIGTRFLQGAMAGTMIPQILSIIHGSFPASERSKAYGLFGAIVGCASAAGMVVGGLLVQGDLLGLKWRPVFLVNVPLGIAVAVAGYLVIREAKPATAPRLDPVGAVLALAATLMLVYPLTEGRSLGWPAWTFALLGGAVVALVVLVGYERWRAGTIGSPLVVLRLFRARTFSSGLVLLAIFAISFSGFFFTWTLYLQVGLGWAPAHAGLTGVSFALAAMIGSGMSAAVLTPRFGRRVLMAGALANAAGFAGYSVLASHYGTSISSWQMVAPLVLAGGGFGLVIAPIIDLILTDVPVRDAGSASGLLSAIQEVGMALGVALAGTVFFGYLGGTGQAATQLGALATGAAGPGAVAHDFIRAFSLSLWYPVGILAIFFAGLFALPRRARVRDLDAELEAAETGADGPEAFDRAQSAVEPLA